MNRVFPKISLVGAGPGDPELISLKGYKAIKKADVILYDALVHPALVEEAPQSAIKVFVGKRAGQHSFSQEQINFLLVQYAYSHGHVVRLKGGDAFVFGRGHEELNFAQSFEIPVELIPGISSCIAVPELQQVPVTRRGVNESFWVLTATTRSGKLSKDIAVAAQSSATIVILMGLRKLAAIVECFLAQGKETTPVMVVQSGSFETEKVVLGSVQDIVEKVKKAQLGTPAIIVIGDVVALHPNYKSTARQTYPYESAKSVIPGIL
ncbi:MAG: uroporphyrinogen-III C-methyltransferase [Bacteroidota bacterium]